MRVDRHEPVLKSIALYSSSNIYRRILGILNAFIKPKLLSPEMFGLWNILSLAFNYASYLHLGSRESMRYLIPYHIGRGEDHESRRIQDSVFLGTLYIVILITLFAFPYALIIASDNRVRWGFITVTVIIYLRWYNEYYIALLKAHQRFRLISFSSILDATIAVMSGAVLIYFLGIYGVYLSAVLSEVIVIWYLRTRYPLEPHGIFIRQLFWELIKKGFPVMIFNLGIVLVRTCDRVVVSSFLGNTKLGYYGIAVTVLGFLLQIPGASREVIEPRFMQQMHEKSKEDNLRRFLFHPLIVTAYFMPFLIGSAFFVLPVFITIVLPNYSLGIVPAQIVVIGAYFLSLTYVMRGIVVVHNWQMKSMTILALSLVVNITMSITFLQWGLELTGVALSSSLTYCILFIGLMLFIKRKSAYALEDWKSISVGLLWPFLIMCISLLTLELIPNGYFTNIVLAYIFKLVVFYMIFAGMIFIASKKYPFIKGIRVSELF